MNIYHDYGYLLYLTSFVCGMVILRRDSPVEYRLLAWLPGITLPVEIFGWVIGHYYHRNHWVYNIFLPLECCVLLLVFYKGVKQPVIRSMSGWLLVLLPAGMIISYWRIHFTVVSINVFALLFYFFLELVGGCLFLTDCLLSGEEASIFSHPLSWTAMGIILYTCIFILTNITWVFGMIIPRMWYAGLVNLANTFFYGSIILSFIALRKKRISRSSPPSPPA